MCCEWFENVLRVWLWWESFKNVETKADNMLSLAMLATANSGKQNLIAHVLVTISQVLWRHDWQIWDTDRIVFSVTEQQNLSKYLK